MGKEENSKPWLRFRIQYKGDDWLFIENYNIKTDNDTYTFTPTKRVERDNGSGDIWEWCDESLNSRTYTMIQDVIKSKSVKIRHNGRQYYKDRRVSSREKAALKNVLDAYEALGGNMNF
jgi:TFIIF-interacting CTD phosphatase-like protein